MRDAIAWSHDLLPPDEQAFFRRVSVFVGGFTLAAAESVASTGWPEARAPDSLTAPHLSPAETVDLVTSLVEKSLLQESLQPDGTARFWFLETIREFGLGQLATVGETEATMRRLADWCLRLLDGAEQGFYSTTQWQWVERFEAEHDNLRAGLAWAIERGDAALALQLVENLGWFWVPRGYLSEGRTWGERALALSAPLSTPGRALALALTSTLIWLQGDYPRARELAVQGLSLSREIGHTSGEGISIMVLGWIADNEGRFDEAETWFTEALTHYQNVGNPTWIGFALNSLGVIDYKRGDVVRAALRFEAARDILRTVGNTYGIGFVLSNLAKVARDQSDYVRAAALYAESVALRYEQGEKNTMAGALRGLASVAAATRRYEHAARLWGAAEALSEAIGAPLSLPHAGARAAIAATRRGLGDSAFVAAWAAGRSLSLAEAVAEALQTTPSGPSTPEILPSPPEQHGLTAREVEVLRLVAAGCSNPTIAEALFISRRTAQTHVQHILNKLNVSTRAEAAVYAMQHGLLA
jgi:non-specific serine/threonine protein kinase